MAARDLTAGMLAEITAVLLRPVIFFEGEFHATGSPSAQFLRLWSGVGELTWDSKVWTGGGNLLHISPLEDSTRIEALGFTVTLSGLPSDKISLALQSIRQGKPGKLWLGCLDASDAVVADPYLIQQGRFDIVVIDDNGETCTIMGQYESRLVDLLKPRIRRYTHEDQQIDHPGDNGFRHVAGLQDAVLIWGGPGGVASPVAMPAPNNSPDAPDEQWGD